MMKSPTAALLDVLTSVWGKPSSATVAGHGIQVAFVLDQTTPAGAIMKLMRPELRMRQTPLRHSSSPQGILVTIEGYGTSARITLSSDGGTGCTATATVMSAKGLLGAVIESISDVQAEPVKPLQPGKVIQLHTSRAP